MKLQNEKHRNNWLIKLRNKRIINRGQHDQRQKIGEFVHKREPDHTDQETAF